MVSADTSNLEVAGVPLELDGASLGDDALSLVDELGHHYFGEQYSDANGGNAPIAPASEFKSATALQLKLGSFFAELKRRDVYKVAIAYIVAGWAFSQGIAQVFPVFDVPNWAIRLFVLLIIIGLPIALVLAWIFELTPEGIKRTADISPDEAPDVVRQLEAQARQQFVRGYLCALIYAGLGDKAEAIDYLKRQYLNHENIDTTSIRVDPMLGENAELIVREKNGDIHYAQRPSKCYAAAGAPGSTGQYGMSPAEA
jgi:hypothetical protein